MPDLYIHPTALVETDYIGPGTRIWAFTHVMPEVSIGRDCNIGEHCFLESGVMIGNGVTVKNGTAVWAGVTLADGVFVGPQVCFTNDRYPRSPRLAQVHKRYSSQSWRLPTFVGQGATLGAGAVLVAGITIGDFAMVGAGSVVPQDVPAYALAVGNPAKVVGWVCQCGQPVYQLGGSATCSACGLSM